MTPHQKIMRAARRGTGLRLTADEVFGLSQDDAIATCAANDDANAKGEPGPTQDEHPDWPRRWGTLSEKAQ